MEQGFKGSSEPITSKPQWPVGMATPTNRLAAFVLDLILIVPVVKLLQSPMKRGMLDSSLMRDLDHYNHYQNMSLLVFITVFCLYHTLMIYWKNQTFGKMFFAIKVLPLSGRHSWFLLIIRSLTLLVSLVPFAIPLITLFHHPMRRSFHDRVSDTIVVSLKEGALLPTAREKYFSIFVYSFVGTFMTTMFVIYFFMSPSKSLRSTDISELECLNKARVNSSDLAKVIESFLLQEVTESCLYDVARSHLWAGKNKELAQLAMAMSLKDKKEESDAYLNNICEESPEHRICLFSQWIKGVIEDQSLALTEISELRVHPETEDFIKLFVAIYSIQNGLVEEGMGWLQRISRDTVLHHKVSQVYFQSLLSKGEFENAYLLYQTHLGLKEEDVLAFLQQAKQLDSAQKVQIIDRFYPTSRSSEEARLPASTELTPLQKYRKQLVGEI
jgi:uncharacterized RDD family membrane protein YckC